VLLSERVGGVDDEGERLVGRQPHGGAERALGGTDPGKVYLVGGSASLPEAPKVFEKVLGVTVDRPEEPLFPTPLGAAMRSSR